MIRLLFVILLFTSITSFSQDPAERVLFVVDSFPIIDEPDEDDGEVSENDIQSLTVVTDKKEIEKHGFKDIDKVVFITTKEYTNRPEDVRKIPTTKMMERKEGKWHLKGSASPYSGPFIDYYMSGRKQGEGTLKNGRVEGKRTVYYDQGPVMYYEHYINGIENGDSKEYFQNGTLHLEGVYKDGKEQGLWKEWYSTGTLKRQTEFKAGEPIPNKDRKFYDLFSRGIEMLKDGHYSSAIKNFDKAIELNPNYSDVYFNRSLAYMYDMKYDIALVDSDKAIELEPMYMEAYSNRAFVRLRKYEFAGSRTLKKTGPVTVLAGKEDFEIPDDERSKMCADLNKGFELGDKQAMILDAIGKYCK